MKKDKLIAYVDVGILTHLAFEADRRRVSMSTLVREALTFARCHWEPITEGDTRQLRGQAQLFPAVESLDNGA